MTEPRCSACFAPAALPGRAVVLGALCVGVALLAATALGIDIANGKTPWGSGACLATMLFALGWVARDYPREYQIVGGQLVIRTWVRTWSAPLGPARRLSAPWRDRFAINGGFGWYGWFRAEGRTVVAFVTDPSRRVIVETTGIGTVVSPMDVDGFLTAVAAATVPAAGGGNDENGQRMEGRRDC